MELLSLEGSQAPVCHRAPGDHAATARAGQDGSESLALLAAATRELGAIERAGELIAAIPQLALRIVPGAAAALIQVRADGSLETLSRSGAAFDVPGWRIAELARDARRDAAQGRPGLPARRVGRLEMVPLAHGPEGLMLALEGGSAEASAPLGERRLEPLAIFAMVANAALEASRARAALREVAARDAAGLGAIREGVISIDRRRGLAAEQTVARRMPGSPARYTFDHLIGGAPGFLAVLDEARRAATCDVPVLVCGESGTGKEMLAQAIHGASARASGPFLGINVTAIPRELLESELFGYEGGSFTGALSSGRPGKFELAGNGTLLLDEIGDMPLEMQSKLLRVLQERIVQRIGSARDIRVRARIIATTSRDLGEAVEQGRFRLDLYHRLRVLQLRLPPLRERRGDVPRLIDDELRRHAERTQRRVGIAPEVMAALEGFDWPGNVRELRNVIEGELSVLPPGDERISRVPPVLLQPRKPPRSAAPLGSELLPLAEVERQACAHALRVCQGSVARAASALGIAKGTLYNKMKLYGIAQRTLPASAAGWPGACQREEG